MFLVSLLFFFVWFPCGRLSWLHVSFWAHVNIVHHIISYHIITQFVITSTKPRRICNHLFVYVSVSNFTHKLLKMTVHDNMILSSANTSIQLQPMHLLNIGIFHIFMRKKHHTPQLPVTYIMWWTIFTQLDTISHFLPSVNISKIHNIFRSHANF